MSNPHMLRPFMATAASTGLNELGRQLLQHAAPNMNFGAPTEDQGH